MAALVRGEYVTLPWREFIGKATHNWDSVEARRDDRHFPASEHVMERRRMPMWDRAPTGVPPGQQPCDGDARAAERMVLHAWKPRLSVCQVRQKWRTDGELLKGRRGHHIAQPSQCDGHCAA